MQHLLSRPASAILARRDLANLPAALRRVHAMTGLSTVRADNRDPQALFDRLNGDIQAFIERSDSRIENLSDALNAMQGHANGFITPENGAIADPDYSRTFASYARNGEGIEALRAANATGDRAQVHAAMSVGSNTDGGYLAPVEWDRKLHERQRARSPMMRLATVQTTSVGAFTSLWSNDQWGSGWVGETAVRPATTTAALSPIPFGTGEIYANAAATQRLLDDAAINVDTWLINSLEREFTRQQDIAFLSGDGVNKPCGLLSFVEGGANEETHPGGPLTVVESEISYDGLVDFSYSLPAPYRQGSAWLLSSLTAAAIAKLKDGNDQPIWREGLVAGAPATLLGRPVELDEGMPGPDEGNLAIAFGNFRDCYLINLRSGVRLLRDPYTSKPFVHFYATKRVGAGVMDPFAVRLLRVPAA